jgi:F-type H+-transporting ATPase subunit b
MISLRFKSRKKWIKIGSWAFIVLATFFFCFVAPGFCSSDTEGHGASHGTKGWVATDTYRVMNFLVLAVALIFILRKPLKQALSSRITGIQDQLDELEVKKKEAEAKLAEYSEKLASLDQESERIVMEYIRQGEEAKRRILKEAASASEKLEAQAKRNIQLEFKQARERLHHDVLEKALAKAEALVKENVTVRDQEKLVDDYLKKVVET